jgi:hypothetical protein
MPFFVDGHRTLRAQPEILTGAFHSIQRRIAESNLTFFSTNALPSSGEKESGPLSSKRARLVEKPTEMIVTE